MTPTRRKQLERIQRKLRAADSALWGNQGQNKEDQAGRILSKVRARLRPIERAEHYARFDAEFKRRYLIDVAINY